MTKQEILDAIEEYINFNGLQQITGTILGVILEAIAKSVPDSAQLTSSYGGIVNPSDTIVVNPGLSKWFIAKAGSYPNYGGFTLLEKNFNIISYTSDQWSAIEIELPEPDTDLAKLVKGEFNDVTTGEDLVPNLATPLSANYIYYHLDSLVSGNKDLESLRVKLYVAGTIDLVLINLANIVIHSEEKTVEVGVNNLLFTDISSVPKPYYVGIKPKTAIIRSESAPTTNRIWISPSGVVAALPYKIQYNVTVREKISSGLVGKIEENTAAVSQISSLATEINGVFQNQTTGEDLAQTFTSALSANYIYYYKNSLISGTTIFKGTDIKVHTAGTLDLILLGLSNEILFTEEKAVGTGTNSIDFTNISSIPKPYYIAVRPKTAVLRGLSGGDVSNNVWISPAGVVAALNYKVPYSVKKSVETILGLNSKFDSIGIMTASDTTLLQKSLNGRDKTSLLKNQYNIEAELIIPDGRTLEGLFGVSVLKAATGYTGNILKIENRQDIDLKNIKIIGNMANYISGANGINDGANIIASIDDAITNTFIGNQNGILIKNSDRMIMEGLQFSNLSGTGLKVDRAGRDYFYGIKASKIFIANCYKGFESVNESEYSNFTDFTVAACQIGVDINSGNQNFNGLINTRCRIGTLVRGDGYNHAHGLFNGSQIKHHQLAGLVFDNVFHGEKFNGLMMQYANLIFRNSRMVTIADLFFTNGKIQCTNPAKLPDDVTDNPQFKTGKNIITKLDYQPGGGFAIENSGNLIVENSRDMTA